MSIADHFERTPDAGFIRDYDSGAARRQFSVSLVLVTVMAMAVATLGFLVRFDTPSSADLSAPSATPPAYAGRL